MPSSRNDFNRCYRDDSDGIISTFDPQAPFLSLFYVSGWEKLQKEMVFWYKSRFQFLNPASGSILGNYP